MVNKSLGTKICSEATNICRSSVRNCHRVAVLTPGILRWLLDLPWICAPMINVILSLPQTIRPCALIVCFSGEH
jgi:hypothetical protein